MMRRLAAELLKNSCLGLTLCVNDITLWADPEGTNLTKAEEQDIQHQALGTINHCKSITGMQLSLKMTTKFPLVEKL